MLPIILEERCHYIQSPILCLHRAPIAVKGAIPAYTVCGQDGRMVVIQGDCRRCKSTDVIDIDKLYDAYTSLLAVAPRGAMGTRIERRIDGITVKVEVRVYADKPIYLSTGGVTRNIDVRISLIDDNAAPKTSLYKALSRIFSGRQLRGPLPMHGTKLDSPLVAVVYIRYYRRRDDTNMYTVVQPSVCMGIELPEAATSGACSAISISIERMLRLTDVTGFPLLDVAFNTNASDDMLSLVRASYELALRGILATVNILSGRW